MKKRNRGYSYASIMVALVVIQIITLTFVSTVVTTNNAADKSNNTILGIQLADSYLDFAEVAIANTSGLKGDSAAIEAVYQQVQNELRAFNANSERFDVSVFFQCDLCSGIDNPDLQSSDFTTGEDFVEVTIQVKHKSSKVITDSEEESLHSNRLVVLP